MRSQFKNERGNFFSPTGIWTMVPWNWKPWCYHWATLTPYAHPSLTKIGKSYTYFLLKWLSRLCEGLVTTGKILQEIFEARKLEEHVFFFYYEPSHEFLYANAINFRIIYIFLFYSTSVFNFPAFSERGTLSTQQMMPAVPFVSLFSGIYTKRSKILLKCIPIYIFIIILKLY